MIDRQKAPTLTAAQPRLGVLRRDGLLVIVTIIWGATFLVMKHSARAVGVYEFLAIRFAFGFLALFAFYPRRCLQLTKGEMRAGLVLGALLFACYALQTTGLLSTTTSVAGFLTGLYVPIVPLLAVALLRKPPGPEAILGVVMSLAGLALLCLDGRAQISIGPGERLVIACAVTSALHIVATSRYAPDSDQIRLALVQIGLVSLLSAAAVPLSGQILVTPPPSIWIAGFLMGSVATAWCIATMTAAQKTVSPTRATLIYALEPVWAGIFGYTAGESLSPANGLGCVLIFAGMVVGQVRFTKSGPQLD